MLTVALILVALLCALIELVQAQGRSLLTWAVFLLALALLWPHLPTLR
jgi:hypothetical protein